MIYLSSKWLKDLHLTRVSVLPLYPVCNIMPWTKSKHLMDSFIDKYSRDTQLSCSLIVTLAFYLHTANQNVMILLILFCLMMLSFVIIKWIEYIKLWVKLHGLSKATSIDQKNLCALNNNLFILAIAPRNEYCMCVTINPSSFTLWFPNFVRVEGVQSSTFFL